MNLPDKLHLGVRNRSERLYHTPGQKWIWSEYPVSHYRSAATLPSLHKRIYLISGCWNSIGQGVSVSVCPPSRARHPEILPQGDLVACGI